MLMEIKLDELAPSPTNPRKTFDQVKLEELARSIAEKGLIQPIVVRQANGSYPERNGQELRPPWDSKVRYEIVAGERRYRASKIAGVETVLCIVRDLDDLAVLECQTIENLQRDDLHPLEEADGYAALMMQAGWDVQEIADKIGKSGKYVYDRIKLRQLVPELREVFLAGEISAGHAILLARLEPIDQGRALGDGPSKNSWAPWSGGLFQRDDFQEAPGFELGDQVKRKARSVRELETWINDHVRFKPEEVDLPNLFPETGATLAAAAEEELKIVKITFGHQLQPETRDESERTYSRPSWRRADGGLDQPDGYGKPKPSKECSHSVLGIVVAGRGRGQSFKVCVAKKKCRTHWSKEIKESEQRAKNGGVKPGGIRDHQRQNEEQRRLEREKTEAEEARWAKATDRLLEALAEKLQEKDPLTLVDQIIERIRDKWRKPATQLKRGKTLEDAVRYMAFLVISDEVVDSWQPATNVPRVLKPFGIDAKKIVDQVAPKEKKQPEKKAKAKKVVAGICRECGCTDDDCSVCIERTGEACTWIEDDLCSACGEFAKPKKDGRKAAGARAAAKARKAKRVQKSADVSKASAA